MGIPEVPVAPRKEPVLPAVALMISFASHRRAQHTSIINKLVRFEVGSTYNTPSITFGNHHRLTCDTSWSPGYRTTIPVISAWQPLCRTRTFLGSRVVQCMMGHAVPSSLHQRTRKDWRMTWLILPSLAIFSILFMNVGLDLLGIIVIGDFQSSSSGHARDPVYQPLRSLGTDCNSDRTVEQIPATA